MIQARHLNNVVRILTMATATALLVGCGPGSVSADEVETQAEAVFKQQFPVDSVDCTDPLPAEVGASTKCVLVSEGKRFEMMATTTEVTDGRANFDLELTKEL